MNRYIQLYKLLFYAEHFLGKKMFEKFFVGFLSRLDIKTRKYLSENPIASASLYETTNILDSNKIENKCPVFYKGVAKDWSAVNKWTLDYLSEHYGEKEIAINNNRGLTDTKLNHSFLKMTLRDYIQELKSGSLKYLKLSSLVNEEKSLQMDLELNILERFKLKGSTGETFYSFIGGKGTVTPMHNEFPCNVYVQIYGKKKWILYPPDDFFLLNTHASRRPYFYTSANPNNEDKPEFPLLRHAKKIELILEPGDILWVPPFYWHYVENLTDSISVAYKFANIRAAAKTSLFFSSLFFMATNPSPIYGAVMSRLKKTDYVLEEKHA